MYNFRTLSIVKSTSGVDYYYGEINCDTAADLPQKRFEPNKELMQGSLAWDIATGDFYGLNSSGTWVKQNGGE